MNEEIEFSIRNNTTWTKLPNHIKQFLNNSQYDYEKLIVNYCIKNQIRYRSSIVKQIKKDEKAYYKELLQYSQKHLMLYPYHLSDIFVKGLRVTPFNYYIDLLCELMQSERSYDSLPNFTAADSLRLIGIGRNQYIDIMNQYRSKKSFFSRKKPARMFLPAQPIDGLVIEPWWIVNVGFVTNEDVAVLTLDERKIVDFLIDNSKEQKTAGELNFDAVHSLYRKGLIYLDVPIEDDEFVFIPPLEGFVMNRTIGDYLENLLYKIFVSIDERTSISELANVLQIDISLVKMAVSMYCRLNFAKKKSKMTTENDIKDDSWQAYTSQRKAKPSSCATLLNSQSSKDATEDNFIEAASDSIATEKSTEAKLSAFDSNPSQKRMAFLFDSALTAFLMMGNLSNGLKSHAVTLFEVGKLSDESLESFLQELDKVSHQEQSEGEAQRYFDHACLLNASIQFLRYNANLVKYSGSSEENAKMGIDLIRVESLASLDGESKKRILAKNYSILISMAPYCSTGDVNTCPPTTCATPYHLGPATPEVNSFWFKLFLYEVTRKGPPTLLLPRGYRIKSLPKQFSCFERFLITSWGHDPFVAVQSNVVNTLNDCLNHSAILFQGYSCDTDETNLVHVAFNDTESPFYKFAPIQKLHAKFNLQYFVGYFTLVCAFESIESRDIDFERVFLLDMRFGIPLFDEKLNADVLRIMERCQLCSKNSLDAMLENSRKLVLNLFHFIDKYRNDPVVDSGGRNLNVTPNSKQISQQSSNVDFNSKHFVHDLHPSKCIFYADGNMRILNSKSSNQPAQN